MASRINGPDHGATQPRVRAVVLNYNTPDVSIACAKSLREQSYTNLDIVVVDNGSKAANYAALREQMPEGMTLIRSDYNRGFAGGHNVGARSDLLPRPDFYLFVNSDCLFPDQDTCRELVSALLESPDCAAVSPVVEDSWNQGDPTGSVQVRRVPDFRTLLFAGSWWLRRSAYGRRLAANYAYEDLLPFPRNTVIPCDSINGACFMVRQSFLEEIGFLDEGTFLYFEELVLGSQMRHRSLRACLSTRTTVRHQQGATTGDSKTSFNARRRIQMIQSELYFCRAYLRAGIGERVLFATVRAIDLAGRALHFYAYRALGRARSAS